MAVSHENIAGTYHQVSEDSSHQASNKFSKGSAKPTDDLGKPTDKGSKPEDSDPEGDENSDGGAN
jgi:hypothetical protein